MLASFDWRSFARAVVETFDALDSVKESDKFLEVRKREAGHRDIVAGLVGWGYSIIIVRI